MKRPGIARGPGQPGKRAGIDSPRSFACALARYQTQTALLLLIALGWAGTAWAAESGDPTEPSPVWLAAQSGTAVKAAGDAATEAPLEIRMILTSRSRSLAVIDKSVVKVGDGFRGLKVVAIKDDRVMVKEDAAKTLGVTPGITTLGVTPGVKKKAPALVAAKKKRIVIPANSASANAIRERKQ